MGSNNNDPSNNPYYYPYPPPPVNATDGNNDSAAPATTNGESGAGTGATNVTKNETNIVAATADKDNALLLPTTNTKNETYTTSSTEATAAPAIEETSATTTAASVSATVAARAAPVTATTSTATATTKAKTDMVDGGATATLSTAATTTSPKTCADSFKAKWQQQHPRTRKVCLVVVVLVLALVVVGASLFVVNATRSCASRAASGDRATRVTTYINCVKLSTGTLAVPEVDDDDTAEAAALAWLVFDDPWRLSPDTDENQFLLRQRYALLTLYLQFPQFTATSEHECYWQLSGYQTTCTDHDKKYAVTRSISADGFPAAPGSTLSPELGLLTNLEVFVMTNNSLMGSIPSSLGTAWTNLQVFNVSGNALTGSVPSSLLSNTGRLNFWENLNKFDVSRNAFTGSIPSAFNNWLK